MILSPLRRLWKRARNAGFVAGYAAGLADGLTETVSEHANVALLPDDVCEAFWAEHEARIAHFEMYEGYRQFTSNDELYRAIHAHLIPEATHE